MRVAAEAVGAVFDEQLGDQIVGEALFQLLFLGRGLGRRGTGLIDFGEAVFEPARVLRAGDDAVADADDDRFDELGGRKGGRGGSDGECKNRFLHAFFFDG